MLYNYLLMWVVKLGQRSRMCVHWGNRRRAKRRNVCTVVF